MPRWASGGPRTWSGALAVRIFPDPSVPSRFDLFDGGAIAARVDGDSIAIDLASPAARRTTLRVLAREPAAVEVGGTELPRVDRADQLTGDAWLFDGRFAVVAFDQASGDSTVLLRGAADVDPPDQPPGDGGCGCRAGAASPVAAALLLLLLVATRRRRTR